MYLIKYELLRSSSWVLSFLKQIKEFIIEDELDFLLKYIDFIILFILNLVIILKKVY